MKFTITLLSLFIICFFCNVLDAIEELPEPVLKIMTTPSYKDYCDPYSADGIAARRRLVAVYTDAIIYVRMIYGTKAPTIRDAQDALKPYCNKGNEVQLAAENLVSTACNDKIDYEMVVNLGLAVCLSLIEYFISDDDVVIRNNATIN